MARECRRCDRECASLRSLNARPQSQESADRSVSTARTLLEPGQFGVIGLLEFLNATPEFRKARTDIRKFPLMLELDAHLLLGEALLENGYSHGKLVDFCRHVIETRLPRQLTPSLSVRYGPGGKKSV